MKNKMIRFWADYEVNKRRFLRWILAIDDIQELQKKLEDKRNAK